ncbi:MAG: ferritin-like domain-containing protein [Acidimicrobiia bacterium]
MTGDELLPGRPILLAVRPMESLAEVQEALQQAIEIELSTLPPYLYAAFTIKDSTYRAARERIHSIVADEMVHMALACNVLNAIGGTPQLALESVVPNYPGPLPYDIGARPGEEFSVSLLPFSEAAIVQAIRIESPEHPTRYPDARWRLDSRYRTIGQFYAALADALKGLPVDAWSVTPRHQLTDHPFFAGRLLTVSDIAGAQQAIRRIVTEGEGTSTNAGTAESPLDFEGELAHYWRLEEIRRNQVLERDPERAEGFSWGGPLRVDWPAVTVIADPGDHDFSGEPAGAQAAQRRCDRAFTALLCELHRAVNGEPARLGNAVAAMFDLRRAARIALATPLADGRAAGPAFRFLSPP